MNHSLKWQLSHAMGYIALGMHEDAEFELEQVAPDNRMVPEVLAIQIDLYQATKDWEKLFEVSEALCEIQPENPGGWVSCAYAMRRLKGVPDAQAILLEAEAQHPEEAIIKFNLGCYSSLLGELDEAEYYVRKAISLDASYKKMAQQDPDLDALRDQGINFS